MARLDTTSASRIRSSRSDGHPSDETAPPRSRWLWSSNLQWLKLSAVSLAKTPDGGGSRMPMPRSKRMVTSVAFSKHGIRIAAPIPAAPAAEFWFPGVMMSKWSLPWRRGATRSRTAAIFSGAGSLLFDAQEEDRGGVVAEDGGDAGEVGDVREPQLREVGPEAAPAAGEDAGPRGLGGGGEAGEEEAEDVVGERGEEVVAAAVRHCRFELVAEEGFGLKWGFWFGLEGSGDFYRICF